MKISIPVFLLFSCFFFSAKAQQPVRQCGTMQAIENRAAVDPAFNAFLQQGLHEFEQSKVMRTGGTARTSSLSEPVIIPVVVHVVLPNPEMIVDADIDFFIGQLNQAFSGFNADSSNGAPFYNVRGHSLIRFARARRDPNGNLTTGVERKTGDIPISQNVYQPVKHASAGGLAPWDVTRYYNLWVAGNGQLSLLGIAPGIGPGNATESTNSNTGIDGVVVDYRVFANNCFADPSFSLARTVIHEIGHNFGLYHTFQGGCGGSDFMQLTTPGCQLPSSLLSTADDTPAESGPNYSCPTGSLPTGCSGTGNRMFQNYMNYSSDQCMTMFTKGQVERMHYVLENCRPGYLASNAHFPPANTAEFDIAPVSMVNPGGVEFKADLCQPVRHGSFACPGSYNPKVRIENKGTEQITSVTVGYTVNGVAQPAKTYSVDISFGNSAVIELPAINFTPGEHIIKIFSSLPNNAVDERMSNDTLVAQFTTGGIRLPLLEDFSSAIFPPNDWSTVRVAGNSDSASWKRASASASGASGSALASTWQVSRGNRVELRSPLITTVPYDSIFISFSFAHRQFNNTSDTLQLLASTNCGTSFVKLWELAGSQLATTTPASGSTQFASPVTNQWRRISVSVPSSELTSIAGSSNVIFAWRAASNGGNNVLIDDINITGKEIVIVPVDVQPISFASPAERVCDPSSATPSLRIRNKGTETITSFNLNYEVTSNINASTATGTVAWNGSLPRDSSATVAFNTTFNQPATYFIKAWTSQPNNVADQRAINDTIRYTFTIERYYSAPFNEGFQGTEFPPANWFIAQQPNDDTTWTRTTNAGSSSSASAHLNTYSYRTNGRIDMLVTPVMEYTNVDSVFLEFDVAAATKSSPGTTTLPVDTLEVLYSTDCGVSFTSIYKKWGINLITTGDPNYPYPYEFVPTVAAHWRTDSIALVSKLGTSNAIRFAFKLTNNFENNVFIDNVNFTTKVIPARVKREGYMITPSPFTTSFTIQHYVAPADLRNIAVYNAVGQQVVSQSFGQGGASSYININMAHLPAGIYSVRLLYTDRTVSQKILKVGF